MKNIVLTGFMGTGKTEVGRELSRLLGFTLIDADEEIVKSEGMSINEIFARDGEPCFRDIETKTLKEISKRENVIVSTGGGAVLREENMAALRERGIIVWLTASPETILARTSNDSLRPLLQVQDPLKKIRELLEYRMPFYKKADILLDTEGKSPLQVAGEIIERTGGA
ncbi:MAG: shikimate kinase [Thermodesulfovibrionales bacterium]|nr:shikimate kinase [Thermodesulfovibrionales bacterium]